jgi:hypothetical protein
MKLVVFTSTAPIFSIFPFLAASITPKSLLVTKSPAAKVVPAEAPKTTVVVEDPVLEPIELFVTAYGLVTEQEVIIPAKNNPYIYNFIIFIFYSPVMVVVTLGKIKTLTLVSTIPTFEILPFFIAPL